MLEPIIFLIIKSLLEGVEQLMSSKTIIYIAIFIGSIIGAYIPRLWGTGLISFSSIIFSALGALVGFIIARKWFRDQLPLKDLFRNHKLEFDFNIDELKVFNLTPVKNTEQASYLQIQATKKPPFKRLFQINLKIVSFNSYLSYIYL